MFTKVKKVVAYISLFCLLIRPLISITMISYYNLNISEITEKHCINKDKPALHCDGKCYLSQKLNQVDDSNDNTTKINLAESFMLVYFNNPDDDFSFTVDKIFENNSIHSYVIDNYTFLDIYINTPPPKHIS